MTRIRCVDRLQGKPADPAAEKSIIDPAFPRTFCALRKTYAIPASNIRRHPTDSSDIRLIWRYLFQRYAISFVETCHDRNKRTTKKEKGAKWSRATRRQRRGVVRRPLAIVSLRFLKNQSFIEKTDDSRKIAIAHWYFETSFRNLLE